MNHKREELKRIIQIAGCALEREDKLLRNIVKENDRAYPKNKSGILRFKNERFYQYTVAKGLMEFYEYAIELERKDNYDLIATDLDNSNKLIVEMKKWMSSEGSSEIPFIKKDIEKLKNAEAELKILMIFSANPKDKTEENLEWFLEEVINKKQDSYDYYIFPTIDPKGDSVDFWVGGFVFS